MKTTTRTSIFALLMLAVLPAFSQDSGVKTDKKTQPETIKEESKSERLRKISSGSARDWDFDVHIDHVALEKNIKVAIESAMKSVEALEKLEINIEPIEINLNDLKMDLDPIIVNIPDPVVNIDPIEINVPDIDVNVDVDRDHFSWRDEDNDIDNDNDNDNDHHRSFDKEDSDSHWDKHKEKEKMKDKSYKEEKEKVKDKSGKEEKEKAKGLKKLN